jgi:hypothetical protein
LRSSGKSEFAGSLKGANKEYNPPQNIAGLGSNSVGSIKERLWNLFGKAM